jgi:hypothetical protein
MKVLVEAAGDRILGFTMIGAEAGEVMAAVQTAILGGLPYTLFRDAIRHSYASDDGRRTQCTVRKHSGGAALSQNMPQKRRTDSNGRQGQQARRSAPWDASTDGQGSTSPCTLV